MRESFDILFQMKLQGEDVLFERMPGVVRDPDPDLDLVMGIDTYVINLDRHGNRFRRGLGHTDDDP